MKFRRELCPLQETRCAGVSSAEISDFNWHQQYFVVLLEEIQLKIKKTIFMIGRLYVLQCQLHFGVERRWL